MDWVTKRRIENLLTRLKEEEQKSKDLEDRVRTLETWMWVHMERHPPSIKPSSS